MLLINDYLMCIWLVESQKEVLSLNFFWVSKLKERKSGKVIFFFSRSCCPQLPPYPPDATEPLYLGSASKIA
jgi:hypothetical protein